MKVILIATVLRCLRRIFFIAGRSFIFLAKIIVNNGAISDAFLITSSKYIKYSFSMLDYNITRTVGARKIR